MPFKLNVFTGTLDYYEAKTFRGVSASAPTSPEEGWTYVNSGDNGYYIYYGGTWQLLHTLTPATLYELLLETGGTDSILLESDVGGTDFLALEA
jgi:hypothetical protein